MAERDGGKVFCIERPEQALSKEKNSHPLYYFTSVVGNPVDQNRHCSDCLAHDEDLMVHINLAALIWILPDGHDVLLSRAVCLITQERNAICLLDMKNLILLFVSIIVR
jgi:hypothetical protein